MSTRESLSWSLRAVRRAKLLTDLAHSSCSCGRRARIRISSALLAKAWPGRLVLAVVLAGVARATADHPLGSAAAVGLTPDLPGSKLVVKKEAKRSVISRAIGFSSSLQAAEILSSERATRLELAIRTSLEGRYRSTLDTQRLCGAVLPPLRLARRPSRFSSLMLWCRGLLGKLR